MKEYCFLAPVRLVETFTKVRDFVPDSLKDISTFMQLCGSKTTAFFELGDFEGVVWFTNLTIGWKATVHIVRWSERLRHQADKDLATLQEIMDLFQLYKVEAYIPISNERACRYAIQLGFNFECTLPKWDRYDGVAVDISIYSLLKEK